MWGVESFEATVVTNNQQYICVYGCFRREERRRDSWGLLVVEVGTGYCNFQLRQDFEVLYGV